MYHQKILGWIFSIKIHKMPRYGYIAFCLLTVSLAVAAVTVQPLHVVPFPLQPCKLKPPSRACSSSWGRVPRHGVRRRQPGSLCCRGRRHNSRRPGCMRQLHAGEHAAETATTGNNKRSIAALRQELGLFPPGLAGHLRAKASPPPVVGPQPLVSGRGLARAQGTAAA
jgi:hypothetical protein